MISSLRRVLATPSFTVPAVGALAIAIAATTAVFSVVHVTMLQSMGFSDTDRLVSLWATDSRRGQKQIELCFAELLDWQKQTDLFEGVALASSVNLDYPLLGDGVPQQVDGTTVSGAFFRTLGAKPVIGRLLDEQDDRGNVNANVVISYRLWQSRYGGDRAIAGKTVRLGDGAVTIVGVTSPDFDFPRDVDVWTPLRASWPGVDQQARLRVFRSVAKLKPGISRESAEARLNVISAQSAKSLPPGAEAFEINAIPMLEEIYGPARTAIWVLMGAVLLVLLIACGNVANLLLARATVRGRELAIRGALGADRSTLVRLLVGEAFLLSGVACALGLALAWAGIRVLSTLAPPEIPRIDAAAMNAPVIVFGIAISLATVMLFGLAPSLIASRRDPNDALKQMGHHSLDRSKNRLRGGLVAAEVALSLVLLVGAVLLIRSFQSLSSVEPGFRSERVLTFRVTTSLPQQDQPRLMYGAILEKLRALPGVESAAAILLRPLSGLVGWDGVYWMEEQSAAEQSRNPNINYEAISPDYFRTMGIRLLSGRDFTDTDTDKSPGVVIINESTARRHWPESLAIGKRVRLNPSPQSPWLTVVGIAKDVRYREWEAIRPDFYVPYTQRAQHRSDFVIKTHGEPEAMANAVRQAVFAVNRDQPISQVTTMDRLIDRALSRSRFVSLVLTSLALTAVLLAVLGIYGVLSYSIAQGRLEIGIRMALGATPSGILNQVLRNGLRLALLGSLVGLGLALICSRAIATLLFGVKPIDPLSYGAAIATILLLAAAACALPAWRAAQEQPISILKAE